MPIYRDGTLYPEEDHPVAPQPQAQRRGPQGQMNPAFQSAPQPQAQHRAPQGQPGLRFFNVPQPQRPVQDVEAEKELPSTTPAL